MQHGRHSPLMLLRRRIGTTEHGHTAAWLQSNGNLTARRWQKKWSEERLVYNDFKATIQGAQNKNHGPKKL